jgi:hypothetical protein
MMADQTELRNRIAGEIVASIVRPPLEAGGGPTDVLVVLESVIGGVFLALVKLGGDVPVIEAVTERAKERLTKLRLTNLPTSGEA